MCKVHAHILQEMAALENRPKVRLFLDRMARSQDQPKISVLTLGSLSQNRFSQGFLEI
jgi:hypothetical protein